MFLTFASGLLAGVLSGILFAFAFTWDAIGELESGSALLTSMTWIVPTIYGSVFAVGYAFLATSGVTIIFPLVSWITRQPTVAHALTTCFVLSAVFYLWQSPTTPHATMINWDRRSYAVHEIHEQAPPKGAILYIYNTGEE